MKPETRQRIDKRLVELNERTETLRFELREIITELDKMAAERIRIETSVGFLDIPVSSFRLSDRVQKILTKNNIVTVEDIGELQRLRCFRNIGDQTMIELTDKIGHLLI
jgi:hypothetical protein